MNDEDLNFVKKKKKEIEISRTYIRWKDIIIREKKWETNIYIGRRAGGGGGGGVRKSISKK